MEFVAGIFFFLLGLSAIAGTFKKPKNDDEAKKLEIFKNHKWKFRIGGFILMYIGSVLIVDNSQSTVETSTQQQQNQVSTQQQQNQTSTQQQENQAPKISKKDIISFYNEKYPEATILGGDDEASINFPSKSLPHPFTDFVGLWNPGDYFVVNCDLGFKHDRNLDSKKCLSNEDKEGRSIIEALYYLYKIEKPSMEEFINFIRHNCIESECDIENIPVIASGNKKYMVNFYSQHISPNNNHIQLVRVLISPAK